MNRDYRKLLCQEYSGFGVRAVSCTAVMDHWGVALNSFLFLAGLVQGVENWEVVPAGGSELCFPKAKAGRPVLTKPAETWSSSL